MDSPDMDLLTPLMLLLSALELLLELVSVLASSVNLFLITRTPLIHPNLKHILVYQSATILLRALVRIVMCSWKFILWDPLASEAFEPWRFVYILCVYNRNFIGHVLIIERTMATLATMIAKGKGGYRRSWMFTVLWITIVFGVSLYNLIVLGSQKVTITNFVTNTAFIFVGAFELFIFKILWSYNEKLYKRHKMMDNGAKAFNLSELYQISENIRIGKQLMPTLFFHLINVLNSNLIVWWAYFALPFFPLILVMVPSINAFCSLMIEITMITCHPFLKRDFTSLVIRRLLGLGRRSNVVNDALGAGEGGGAGIAVRDIISGQQLIEGGEAQERHFAMLAKFWE